MGPRERCLKHGGLKEGRRKGSEGVGAHMEAERPRVPKERKNQKNVSEGVGMCVSKGQSVSSTCPFSLLLVY